MMTLVASALAGGDCIDDADALRTGGTACTLGTYLRSFRWGGRVAGFRAGGPAQQLAAHPVELTDVPDH